MTYPEAKQVLTGLLDAFDRDEHGDYFYENGWEVCEAVILAMGAFEDIKVVKTNADHIRSMTDGELADYISENCISDFCFIVCGGDCKAMATFNKTSGQVCRGIVSNWLKQPYYKEDT